MARPAQSAGVISFNGTPPAPKKIDTTADPVCGQKNPNLMTDDTIVKDGKLANVFVYIKEGTVDGGKKVGDYAWATPTTAAKLDQNGCHYSAARDGRAGESEDQHHQQRRDPAQHSPDAKTQSGVEPDPVKRSGSNRKELCAAQKCSFQLNATSIRG